MIQCQIVSRKPESERPYSLMSLTVRFSSKLRTIQTAFPPNQSSKAINVKNAWSRNKEK